MLTHMRSRRAVPSGTSTPDAGKVVVASNDVQVSPLLGLPATLIPAGLAQISAGHCEHHDVIMWQSLMQQLTSTQRVWQAVLHADVLDHAGELVCTWPGRGRR